MKGRRKVKTNKWSLIAAYEAEFRELLKNRPSVDRQSQRFFEVAAEKGRDFETVGPMAGKSS